MLKQYILLNLTLGESRESRDFLAFAADLLSHKATKSMVQKKRSESTGYQKGKNGKGKSRNIGAAQPEYSKIIGGL